MGSMDILIRDIPEPVHTELVRRASARNISLRAYVADLLTAHVRTLSLEDWLEKVQSLPPATGASGKTGADWVAEARAEADDAANRGSRR